MKTKDHFEVLEYSISITAIVILMIGVASLG